MGARSRILRLFLTDVDRERAWEEVRSRVPGTKLLDDRLISLPLPAEAIVDSPSQIAGPMLVLWSPEVDPGYATRTSPRGLNQPDGGIILRFPPDRGGLAATRRPGRASRWSARN